MNAAPIITMAPPTPTPAPGDPPAMLMMVISDSPAAECGFEVGQVILSIADQPVDTAGDVITRLIERGLFQGRSVKVTVQDSTEGASPDPTDITFRLRAPARQGR